MNSTAGPERMGLMDPATYTAEQKKVVEAISAGPRGKLRHGPFAVMLRSPELTGPAQQMGEYLRFKCPMDRRVIELTCILTARAWTQQYEWFAHSVEAAKAGIRPETIAAIGEGRRPDALPADEQIVYDF